MKVIVPKYSGFCPGVKHAEKRIFEENESKDEQNELFVYGDLIHNRLYIEHLRQNGIKTAQDIGGVPESAAVAIRTHGLDRGLETGIRNKFEVVDLTCAKVKKLQLYIKRHADEGFFVVITGKRSHPEVQGLVSYAADYFVVETEQDIAAFLQNMDGAQQRLLDGGYQKLLLVSQTTASPRLFERTVHEVRAHFENSSLETAYSVACFDSVCAITSRREKEALTVQNSVDVSFVVGDRMSSNANRLFQTLKSQSEQTHFIQDLKELDSLDLPLARYKTAQVVSSSSTPAFVERAIIEFLESV